MKSRLGFEGSVEEAADHMELECEREKERSRKLLGRRLKFLSSGHHESCSHYEVMVDDQSAD